MKHVKALTDENQDYIYPLKPVSVRFPSFFVLSNHRMSIIQNGVVDTKRPYFHPCIISSIKEFFFAGNRGSLSQKYEARFSSSIHDGLGKDELELPIPIVCIVATTVSLIYLSLIACDTDPSRPMLRLMTGIKGINGAKVTSVLKLMKISTEVMNSSLKPCVNRIWSSFTP